jgi:hypothetical protein
LVWQDVEEAHFSAFCFIYKGILHVDARILGAMPHDVT